MMQRGLLLSLLLLAGCGPAVPPPGWVQGGAPLWIPRAVWRAGMTNIDLQPDGRVIMNGLASFSIDPAGRVSDADGIPVALLQPDGRLVGTKGEDLGTIGPVTASSPGARYAWLGILPSGQVVRFDDGGSTQGGGVWVGCGGYAQSLHACMLVTYMVATRFPPPPVPSQLNSPWGPSPWSTPYQPGIGFGLTPW